VQAPPPAHRVTLWQDKTISPSVAPGVGCLAAGREPLAQERVRGTGRALTVC